MTWFKVDDRFHSHPKVLALRSGQHEDTALALWLRAGSWCAANLTDGAVPSYVVDTLVRRNGTKAARELVRVRLWDATDDGYQFRAWDEYQPSRAEVEEKRNAVTERVRRHRTERMKRGCNALHDGYERVSNASVTPPPSRPVPTSPSESARAPETQASPGMAAMMRSLSARPEGAARVVEAVSRARQAAGGGAFRPSSHQDRDAVDRLAEWADATPDGWNALGRALAGFFGAKGPAGSLRWFADEDPGRWASVAVAPKPEAPKVDPLAPLRAKVADLAKRQHDAQFYNRWEESNALKTELAAARRELADAERGAA